jgi:hypothetical protein
LAVGFGKVPDGVEFYADFSVDLVDLIKRLLDISFEFLQLFDAICVRTIVCFFKVVVSFV